MPAEPQPGSDRHDGGAYTAPLTTPAAPVDRWAPDVLGDGFEARSVELAPDDEGPAVATVVRHRPASSATATPPRLAVLYLHGWNDYFHQTELTERLSADGAACYALDLRRYGRSLRPGDLPGYVTSLATYEEDIDGALRLVREDHPGLPLVLMGHSTGGLIASLWAHHHPGALAGLVLNAPWLDIQGSWLRALGQPVIDGLARLQPRAALRLPDPGFYTRTLRGSEAELSAKQLAELTPEQRADPAVAGWPINWSWRQPTSVIRPGWLAAVLAGHAMVADGLRIDAPILTLTSARSLLATRWSTAMRDADTVIDVELTARRALQLGPLVTVTRLEGAIHDVMLSRAAVRERAYRELSRWLRAYAVPAG